MYWRTRAKTTPWLAFDAGRTQLGGAPGGVELTAIPGNRYALASSNTREPRALPGFCLRNAHGASSASESRPRDIHRSGSMEGGAAEYVSRACNHVVDLLEPSDILSIITFEDCVDLP